MTTQRDSQVVKSDHQKLEKDTKDALQAAHRRINGEPNAVTAVRGYVFRRLDELNVEIADDPRAQHELIGELQRRLFPEVMESKELAIHVAKLTAPPEADPQALALALGAAIFFGGVAVGVVIGAAVVAYVIVRATR